MKKIIIKTDVEIGEFLGNSRIDGKTIRRLTEKELESLFPSEYEIVQTLEDYISDQFKNITEEQQIDFYKEQYLNSTEYKSFIKHDIKHYNIDWDKVTKIEDIKNILMVADIHFNINFNIDNDVRIYNIVKNYLKE